MMGIVGTLLISAKILALATGLPYVGPVVAKNPLMSPGTIVYANARYKWAKSSLGAFVTKFENASAKEAFCDMS